MAAGISPETPVTNKSIKVQGIETQLGNTDVDTLLNTGVMPLEFDRDDNAYKIIHGITTWQKDANVIFRKLAGMRIHDTLRREVRNTAKPFVGRVSDLNGVRLIRDAIASKLRSLTRDAQNPNGILTTTMDDSGVEQPSFKNLVVLFDGLDWVQISVDTFPVGEFAYITIDAKMKRSKITA
jgi:hypothetical protein